MSEKNLELYNRVRSVPATAKSPIMGGRMSGKTSIEPMWRIKTLTELFGPCGLGWYYVPVKKWSETAGGETVVFVDIELYVKFEGEWSKPIAGTGGASLASNQKGGLFVSDECYKMATTDAISVACRQLGIGADVYWEGDKGGGRNASSNTSSAGSARDKGGSRNTSSAMNARPSAPVQEAEPVLEARYINSLLNELKRTGIGKNSLLQNYGKKDIREINFEEYKDAMNKLCSKPDKPDKSNKSDKPLNPSFIPPNDQGDPASPWNSGKPEAKENQKLAPVQETGTGSYLSAELMEEGYTYCGSFGGN